MKDALKYGLLLAGAGIAAHQLGLLPELTLPWSAPGAGDTGSNGDAGSGDTGNNGDAGSSSGDTGSNGDTTSPGTLELMKAARGNNSANFDEWNWFYAQLTGTPGPAPEDVGLTRIDPMPAMTVETWAAAVTAGGFQL